MAVATFFFTLALAEVGLWWLAPIPDPYATLKIKHAVNRFIRFESFPFLHIVTEAEPGLPGVSGRKHYTTNNFGFRGDTLIHPKPEDEYRVFMVGGSTTECFYLDDREAPHSVLQEYLADRIRPGRRVRVYNTGASGARSDDHIALVAHQLAQMEPDLFVIFAGINDLIGVIRGLDYLHRGLDVQQVEGQQMQVRLLLQMLATESQLGRRTFALLKASRPRTEEEILEQIPRRSDYRDKAALQRAAPQATAPPPIDSIGFLNNMRSLTALATSTGAKVVLMTQQTTWNSQVDSVVGEWEWLRYHDGVVYSAPSMDAALESLNRATRTVAREFGVPLYDLAATMPKSLDYFYDDVHFNVRGARTAAEGVGRVVVSSGLLPGAASPAP